MWFDGKRQPNTLYVASISRGKDSTAMLRAIALLGFPLDAIVSVDIWFDEDTPAELPPMVAFKDEYDQKVLEMFGVPVTRVCATKRERERESGVKTRSATHGSLTATCSIPSTKKAGADTTVETMGSHMLMVDGASNSRLCVLTYCDIFYRPMKSKKAKGDVYGYPQFRGNWCTGLKVRAMTKSNLLRRINGFSNLTRNEGQKINIVQYIGIAADEPLRIARHMPAKDKVLPLVQIGWNEDLCGLEARYMGMLSPTYSDGQLRDGCWFCHNQNTESLRRLRKNYPELWGKLMKLDNDSPVSFHPDGHTVHDYEERFQLEDDGLIDKSERFRWTMLGEELNYRLF